MSKKLNPFINIKLSPLNGFIVVDNLNKKEYFLDKNLLNIFADKNKFIKLEGTSLVSDLIELNKLRKLSEFWFDYNLINALNYHLRCYKYPFLDYKDGEAFKIDNERMGLYQKEEKMPSYFKIYDTKKIKLEIPKNFPKISLNKILHNNVIKYNNKFELEELNFLLYSTFANTTSENIKNYITRPVPSGGGKHPQEAYIIFPKNSILSEGVYHYSVKNHELEIISKEDVWEKFTEATYKIYKKIESPKFAIIHTLMVERAMYRYREIRSTRAVLIDIGHIIAHLKIVSRALGLDYISEYKSKENVIKEILKLKSDSEPVISTQVFYEKKS